jgi:hypothetical protein
LELLNVLFGLAAEIARDPEALWVGEIFHQEFMELGNLVARRVAFAVRVGERLIAGANLHIFGYVWTLCGRGGEWEEERDRTDTNEKFAHGKRVMNIPTS